MYLAEKEWNTYQEINPYTHLKGTSPQDLFALALYPYFDYYSKKNGSIETVPNETNIKEISYPIPNGEICITFVKNSFFAFWYNLIRSRGGTIFYINKDIATKDVEQTWKILVTHINFHTIKKVHFHYPHFTKIVHAYRIATIYNKDIVDITY